MSGVDKFISRALVLFGNPDSPDPKGFLEEYTRHLRGYDPEVLDRAMDILLKTRKFKTWPSIGEIVEAAGKAGSELPKAPTNPFPTKRDHVDKAEAVLNKPVAVKAAREGWIMGLYDHWSEFGREPTQREIEEMIDGAKFVDRCATGGVDMGAAHKMLLKLSHSMLIRREKLARRALGEHPLTDQEAEEMRQRMMASAIQLSREAPPEKAVEAFRPIGDVSSTAFSDMQRNSPNRFHRGH